MNIFETFVTKSENLNEAIINIQQQGLPEYFNREFLAEIGFNNPNCIHYVSLFKTLGLVDENEKPVSKYYLPFIESEELAKAIIANLLKEAYKEVFEKDINAHKLPKNKTIDIFRSIMGKGKSNTFVKLVTNTFIALCQYADWDNNLSHQFSETDTKDTNGEPNSNSLEEVVSAHEEFILELMHEHSHHYEPNFMSPENDEENTNLLLQNSELAKGAFEYESHENMALEPVSAHEEFILELMNECSHHNYQPQPIFNEEQNEYEEGVHNSSYLGKEESKNTMKEKEADEEGSEKIKGLSGSAELYGNDKNINGEPNLIKKALIKRSELLVKLEYLDKAVNAYEDILKYAEKDHNLLMEIEFITSTIYKKAAILEELGRFEEALLAYSEVIERDEI